MNDRDYLDREAGRLSMQWYGWGSPVGLGLFFVLLSGAASLIKFVFFR